LDGSVALHERLAINQKLSSAREEVQKGFPPIGRVVYQMNLARKGTLFHRHEWQSTHCFFLRNQISDPYAYYDGTARYIAYTFRCPCTSEYD